MVDRMKISAEDVPELCTRLYINYGTTLAGLVLSPHAPHHDHHHRQKRQSNGDKSKSGAENGDNLDPVAAATAELAALRAEDLRVEREMHEFYKEWHDRVHAALDYKSLFPPRDHPHHAALRRLLASIPKGVAKLIFTNADEEHAKKCLDLMGLLRSEDDDDDEENEEEEEQQQQRDLLPPSSSSPFFDDVITFESIMQDASKLGLVRGGRPVVCKPADQAFRLALRATERVLRRKREEEEGGGGGGERNNDDASSFQLHPSSVAFFDDSTRNVAGAAAAGIFGVLVGRTGLSESEAPGASAQVASVLDLPETLPSLWEAHGAEPPRELLRGGKLRSEAEAELEAGEAEAATAAARGGGGTMEQLRNAAVVVHGTSRKSLDGLDSTLVASAAASALPPT